MATQGERKVLYRVGVRVGRTGSVEAEALLARAGVETADIAETSEGDGVCLSVYSGSRSRAAALRRVLSAGMPTGAELVFETLKPCDWRTRWKEGYVPVMLTRRFRVVPSGMRDGIPPVEAVDDIYIDTDASFGTGTHPTTALTAGLVEGLRGTFSSFLDIGTGSGILGILAFRCGASEVWAVDIDPEAVGTARRNAGENGVRFTRLAAADFSSFRERKRFELVAANLLPQVLIPLRDRIVRSVLPGGRLVVSGIWETDLARFRARFESGDIFCEQVAASGEWRAVLYRRRC